ncbi:MAG: peroxiredoxin family protein [Acidobacteriales bacterium]|nr:peroxiredoxin family protein [Terriglobales bacterium]
MKAYQDGIAKLTDADSVVLGLSVDTLERNARFAKNLSLQFPLLSDEKLSVSHAYGVLNPQTQFANRATFVVDKQGVIQHIEEGNTAIDPTGAVQMCSALKSKETTK